MSNTFGEDSSGRKPFWLTLIKTLAAKSDNQPQDLHSGRKQTPISCPLPQDMLWHVHLPTTLIKKSNFCWLFAMPNLFSLHPFKTVRSQLGKTSSCEKGASEPHPECCLLCHTWHHLCANMYLLIVCACVCTMCRRTHTCARARVEKSEDNLLELLPYFQCAGQGIEHEV